MNDDLKAYVDGELPPDAAEHLRAAMESDSALQSEVDDFRSLSEALRRLPEPEPVGQAATLAALAKRRPLWRTWVPALAGCAAVLLAVATLPSREISMSRIQPAVFSKSDTKGAAAVAEPQALEGAFAAPKLQDTDASAAAAKPSLQRNKVSDFEAAGQARHGTTTLKGKALRATHPKRTHRETQKKLGPPENLPQRPDDVKVTPER